VYVFVCMCVCVRGVCLSVCVCVFVCVCVCLLFLFCVINVQRMEAEKCVLGPSTLLRAPGPELGQSESEGQDNTSHNQVLGLEASGGAGLLRFGQRGSRFNSNKVHGTSSGRSPEDSSSHLTSSVEPDFAHQFYIFFGWHTPRHSVVPTLHSDAARCLKRELRSLLLGSFCARRRWVTA